MKVGFSIKSTVAVGLAIDDIAALCNSNPLTAIKYGKWNGKKTTVEDLVSIASAASYSQACELHIAHGRLDLLWRYAPNPRHATVNGEITIRSFDEAALVRGFVRQLSNHLRASYSCADLEEVLYEDVRHGPGLCWFEDGGWLYALYWYNYFGKDLIEHLLPAPNSAVATFRIIPCQNGATEVITRATPEADLDEKEISRIGKEWKVFRKYRWRGGFKRRVVSDLSSLRESELEPPKAVVGQPIIEEFDAFVANIDGHLASFLEWARGKDESIESSDDAFRVIWKYADDIDASRRLLVGAIATYGEFLRRELGGVWTTNTLFAPPGEPVVQKTKTSLICRAVVEEVNDFLDLPPFSDGD